VGVFLLKTEISIWKHMSFVTAHELNMTAQSLNRPWMAQQQQWQQLSADVDSARVFSAVDTPCSHAAQ